MTSAAERNVLDVIVARKRQEVAEARMLRPESLLEDEAGLAEPPRGFADAIFNNPGVALIAEVKKASPSAGLIRAEFDAVGIARVYENHGATCLSVLTDEHFFQGHLNDMRAVRAAVSLPVLRKEFIIDRYQILEARAAGADCILLIAECLEQNLLADLYGYARELGMDVLIELYEPENLERVLSLNPRLVGVNNRNLKTMVTDLDHTIRLAKQIPASVMLVGESGIRTHEDLLRLKDAGVKAVLVGESLMKQQNIGTAVNALLGRGA